MTVNEIMNNIFISISIFIIIYEVIFLHSLVKNIRSEVAHDFRSTAFAAFVGISIIGIISVLSACIGRNDDIVHFSVPICSFSNIGIVVWATNAVNVGKTWGG